MLENTGLNAGPLYPDMHDHPGSVDAQQHYAKGAAHTAPEHACEHSQREEDCERHIQEEDGAVMQHPLPEEQRQRYSKRSIDAVAAENLLNGCSCLARAREAY